MVVCRVIKIDGAEALTQKAAARLLSVSTSWLRASDAPRLSLPSHGASGRPLLRYSREALLEWAGITRRTAQQDAPRSATASARGVDEC